MAPSCFHRCFQVSLLAAFFHLLGESSQTSSVAAKSCDKTIITALVPQCKMERQVALSGSYTTCHGQVPLPSSHSLIQTNFRLSRPAQACGHMLLVLRGGAEPFTGREDWAQEQQTNQRGDGNNQDDEEGEDDDADIPEADWEKHPEYQDQFSLMSSGNTDIVTKDEDDLTWGMGVHKTYGDSGIEFTEEETVEDGASTDASSTLGSMTTTVEEDASKKPGLRSRHGGDDITEQYGDKDRDMLPRGEDKDDNEEARRRPAEKKKKKTRRVKKMWYERSKDPPTLSDCLDKMTYPGLSVRCGEYFEPALPDGKKWAYGQGVTPSIIEGPIKMVHSNATQAEKRLWIATRAGKYDTVRELLDQGVDANKANRDGETPLHMAAARGQYRVAELLLERGAKASINARTVWKGTPLHTAAEWGKYDIADLLIDEGADIDAEDNNKQTPLHLATNLPVRDLLGGGDAQETVRVLLRRGARVFVLDSAGNTPRDYCSDFPPFDMHNTTRLLYPREGLDEVEYYRKRGPPAGITIVTGPDGMMAP
jgi:hypothetical protein